MRNSALAFAVFLGSVALVTMPKALDHPLTLWINRAVARSDSLDTLMIALNEDFSYSGVALIALLWFCWFDTTKVIARARIIIGTLLCFPIGMLSRLTQHLLASHPRPYYDHAIVLVRPPELGEQLNTWNSFPSDHATVFAGLAVVIWTVRPPLGWIAAGWLALVEIARVYVGAHYPVDLIGGAALAATLIWLAQASPVLAAGRWLETCSRTRPGIFYALAFFVCFQICTLFHGVRVTASALAKIWLH